MTSPLQSLTSSPPWIDLLHQLPIDLSDYTSFLASYSDVVLSPPKDELRIEDLFEDALFEDIKEEPTKPDTIMANNQRFSYSQSFSSSTFTYTSNGKAPQTWRSTESMSSNPQGTTVHRILEQAGQLPLKETLRLDASGKRIGEQPATSGKNEDVGEADNHHVETMEDAKRVGEA